MKIKVLIPLLLIGTLCSSCSTKSYEVNDYRTTMQFHDNFKILQITDLHFGIESDLQKQLNFLLKGIDEVDPDLIILTGDNFMYASKSIVKSLVSSLNEKCKELTFFHPER